VSVAPAYVPDFEVRLGGRELPATVRGAVTSVRYQDGTNVADRVELALANPDLRWLQEHIRGLGFQPFPTGVKLGPIHAPDAGAEGMFDLDTRLELSMGYAGELEDLFEGELTGINVAFPGGGMPSMTLVAHDYLHRLGQGTVGRGFGPLPDFVIASILAAENLLIPAIDPTVTVASTAIAAVNYIFGGTGRKQKGQSDLAFLAEIAASYEADFYTEGNVLYLAGPLMKEYEPRLTLTWGRSLLDFSPKVTTIGQVAGVSMKFTLREIRLEFQVTVFWDFDREVLGISVLPGVAAKGAKAFSGASFSILDQPIASPADIATSALVILNELRTKLNNRLTGSGSAVGDPRIRAGAVIRLDGMGPDFSGDYRVTSATHTIDGSGYRTSFEARREIIP
jgi:phage protein D